MQGLELRFATALKERVQEEMGAYISNLDCIPVGEPEAIAMRFIDERARFNAFEEILGIIDEVQEKLGE